MKLLKFAVILLSAVALYACNTSEQEQPQDKLLTGTTWEYTQTEIRPDTGTPDEVWVTDNILWNALAALQIPYDTTERTAASYDTIRNLRHSTSATLTFTNSRCQYLSAEQTTDSIVHYTKRWKVFHFEPGQYRDPEQKVLVTITNDRIQVVYSGAIHIGEWELTDGSLEIYRGRTMTESQLLENSLAQGLNFDYHRDNNEIILTCDSLKWIGALDRTNWTMEVVQVSPSKRDIYTFELK